MCNLTPFLRFFESEITQDFRTVMKTQRKFVDNVLATRQWRCRQVWAAQHGLKASNTRPQKEATYRLFAGHIADKTLREVTRVDAANFWDELRRLDPSWARSAKAREMTWRELQENYGGHPKGLMASSLNRHMRALSELWKWGEERDRCEGRNPFAGFREKIKPGVNQRGYPLESNRGPPIPIPRSRNTGREPDFTASGSRRGA